MSDDVRSRFDAETAGVTDPTQNPLVGDVLPPGSRAQTEEESTVFPMDAFITEEMVSALFCLPGAMMARKTGHEWWKPSEEEADLLGKASTPAVKYLVQRYLTENSGPFAALGAVLGVVYGPKFLMEMAERKREKPKNSAPPQSSNGASSASSGNEGAGSQPNNSDSRATMDVV
jgi:hypothetical protein